MAEDGFVDDGFVDAAAVADVPLGGQRPALVNGRRILLCRIDEGIFALADLCPHAHQPLGGGAIRGRVIRCPRHGACFDLTTGKPVNGVTPAAVTTYAVRVTGDRVEVKVPPLSGGFMPNFGRGAA